ncbi:MAG: ferritin family protein [Deltaproteobacteria bacterium]
MEIDRYLSASAKIETDDLDWKVAREAGLSEDEVFILTYFADIEGQTVFYLRDLLRGDIALQPEAIGFLSMWNYEEYFHGRALSKLLDVCGHGLANDRTAQVRKTSRIQEVIEANLIAFGATLFPKDFPGITLSWGASQEITTLRGYELLGKRTKNPILRTLCERIALQERRHFAWYFNNASEVLGRSAWARKITRFAMDSFWSPVGVGVKSPDEMLRLIHLFFPGEGGKAMAAEIDERVGELPGLQGISLMRSFAAKAATRFGEPPAERPELRAA